MKETENSFESLGEIVSGANEKKALILKGLQKSLFEYAIQKNKAAAAKAAFAKEEKLLDGKLTNLLSEMQSLGVGVITRHDTSTEILTIESMPVDGLVVSSISKPTVKYEQSVLIDLFENSELEDTSLLEQSFKVNKKQLEKASQKDQKALAFAATFGVGKPSIKIKGAGPSPELPDDDEEGDE